jgi:hypothetical protein
MVHVPTAASVTIVPDTAHTDAVCEVKLTASPDVAVALTVKGDVPNAWLASVPNVIVWLACVTVKPWLTGVAAA